MFLDRHRRTGRERFLYLRVALFFVAAGLLILGAVLEVRWPALAAVGVGIVALLMRFLREEEEEEGGGQGAG